MKWAEIWGRIARPRVIIYADFIDPFCYVGFHNAARAAAAKNIPFEWRGFELNPDTPPEGAYLQTAANSDLRPGMWASVQDFAKQSGLSLAQPERVPNTRLAHLWVHSLQNDDVKKSLIERIYQAYLSDKKDIGQAAILNGIAEDLGLPKEAVERLAGGDSAPLETFRREAMSYQFPGMPAFVFRGKTYFGALSEEAWRKIIDEKKTGGGDV